MRKEMNYRIWLEIGIQAELISAIERCNVAANLRIRA